MALGTKETHPRKFVDAFVASAAGKEYESDLRCATIAEIGETPNSRNLAAATEHLNRNNRISQSHWIGPARILFYFAALASAIWLVTPISQSHTLIRLTATGDLASKILENRQRDEPSDDSTRLILYGDPQADNRAEQWHSLWMSEPDNPAWFSRYLAMRYTEERMLDSELLDEASRIDPENGFWHLVAACIDCEDYLEKVTTQETEDQPGKTEWIATDEDEVLHRIERIHQAAALPRLEARHIEWYQAAISHVPPSAGFSHIVHTTAWLAGEILYGGVNFRRLPNLQEAAMRIAIDRNDPELAAAIIHNWHRISHARANDASSLVEILIVHLMVSQPVELFYQAAQDLNMDREIILLEPIAAAARKVEQHRQKMRNSQDDGQQYESPHRNKTSILGGLVLDRGPEILMDRPDALDESKFRAARRMEHAFFEQMMASPIGAITSFSLVIFGIIWFSAGRMRRAFARRALLLLPFPRLAGFGLLAAVGPLLWYLLITRLTPLGWHEWSLSHGLKTLIVQWGAFLLLILFLPGIIAAILFEKEGAVFAWRWPGGRKVRAIAACGIIAALPASGLILLSSDQVFFEIIWWLSIACMAGVTIGAIWSWWCQRKDPAKKSPRRLVAGLFAAHARLLTLILLVGWLFLTQYEEKAWAARDTLFVLNPNFPALSSSEEEIQRRLQAQILDILGPEWSK